MLVVGQQEEADGTVSVRSRFAGNEGTKSLDEFIDAICKEIRTKEIRKELPEEEKNEIKCSALRDCPDEGKSGK